jgi:hypothetical protein
MWSRPWPAARNVVEEVHKKMSRTTVRYIQMPRLKSLLTSCRRARLRCQPAVTEPRPRVQDQERKLDNRPAASPKKERPARNAPPKKGLPFVE